MNYVTANAVMKLMPSLMSSEPLTIEVVEDLLQNIVYSDFLLRRIAKCSLFVVEVSFANKFEHSTTLSLGRVF